MILILLDFACARLCRQVSQQKRRLSWRATKAALLITLYHSEPIFQLPFQILTLLQDLDELMTTWRTRHGTQHACLHVLPLSCVWR